MKLETRSTTASGNSWDSWDDGRYIHHYEAMFIQCYDMWTFKIEDQSRIDNLLTKLNRDTVSYIQHSFSASVYFALQDI